MSTAKIQMDAADQAEFQRFQDYLNRIFEKYGSDVWAEACANLLSEAIEHDPRTPKESCCSFCGKRASEVDNRMVQGPDVYICVGCIDLCYKVRQKWPERS